MELLAPPATVSESAVALAVTVTVLLFEMVTVSPATGPPAHPAFHVPLAFQFPFPADVQVRARAGEQPVLSPRSEIQ